MSGLYEVEFGKALTWRMYSWHSAWYCQSRRLLPKSPLPRAPSSKSYTPVLWKDKEKSTAEISSQVTLCSHMYECMLKVFFLKYWSNHEAIKHWKNGFHRNPCAVDHLCLFFCFCNLIPLIPLPHVLPNMLFGISLHLPNNIAERPGLLPGWMLSLIMLTCSSRSGRVCSCQNPITWPNSCTTIPNLSQFLPMDMAWGPPPRRPT